MEMNEMDKYEREAYEMEKYEREMRYAMGGQQEEKPKRDAGKITAAVLLCMLWIILFYIIQVGATVVEVVRIMVQEMANNGGNATEAGNAVQDRLLEGVTLTNITMLATLGTALLFGLWYRLGRVKHYTREKFRELKDRICHVRIIALLVLCGMSIYMINIFAVDLMYKLMPGQVDKYLELMGTISGGDELVVFLTIVILAPIGEECLFRGLMLQKLQKVMPIGAAIVLQAVFFGVFHGNLVQGLYVIILGIATGYATYKFKSIIPAILIHAVNNAMSTVLPLLPESLLESDLFFLILLAVILGAFFITLKSCRQAKEQADSFL